MLQFSSVASVNLAFEKINLTEWLFEMDDKEYQRCSKNHLAMGILPGGASEGAINVEDIGCTLMVQHYRTIHKDAHKVIMFSEKSDAMILHFIPINVAVKWEMEITRDLNDNTLFRCTVSGIYPNKILELLGYVIGAPYFVKKHVIEETQGFARSIEAKYLSL